MKDDYDYDVVVVGAGVIGTATAKYTAKNNKRLRVALIGPKEEKDRRTTDVHGSFHDEGRIVRVVDPPPVWNVLAKRSIQRYRQIEEESGITFYNECGYLSVGMKDGDLIQAAKVHGEPHRHLSYTALQKLFSYMKFDHSDEGILFTKDSGYISPRALVQAQIKLARKYGCDVIQALVDKIEAIGSEKGHVVQIASGGRVTTRKVILATGAFTFCRELTPDGILPELYLHRNTVEVDEEEREKLSQMPSVIYKGGRYDDSTITYVCYILPPIQYPNGKYYLKLGHGPKAVPKPEILTPEELHSWFCGGNDPQIEQRMILIVKDLFPDLKMKNFHFDYCCTVRTPTLCPYISMLNPSFGVVLGGCGFAGKSSDELGWAAARMISRGSWDYDLPEDKFKPIMNTPSKL